MNTKLDRRSILLINAGLAVVGGATVILSIILSQSTARILIESIGVGLIATGLVNFFDKLLIETQKDTDVDIIAMQRAKTNQTVYRLKYQSEKVDILGVSIADVLKEFTQGSRHEMIGRILRHSTRLRLLLVHPDANFLIQRAREDHVSWDELHTRQLKSVEMIVAFYKLLLEAYQRDSHSDSLSTGNVGSVEIRLINACPYMSIYRVDNTIYWGLYTTYKTGEDSPLFFSKKLDKEGMFEILKDHVYGLLPKEETDNLYLLKMIIKDQPPILNRTLVDRLLGEKRVDELLK
jgi:hypothetical protein